MWRGGYTVFLIYENKRRFSSHSYWSCVGSELTTSGLAVRVTSLSTNRSWIHGRLRREYMVFCEKLLSYMAVQRVNKVYRSSSLLIGTFGEGFRIWGVTIVGVLRPDWSSKLLVQQYCKQQANWKLIVLYKPKPPISEEPVSSSGLLRAVSCEVIPVR